MSSDVLKTYFSTLADDYAVHRPTYPPSAINAILHELPQPVIAVDVGCGTGISTRLLAQAGASVIGIEPNEPMRQEAIQTASRRADNSKYLGGSAESTGLPDATFDLVLCAQSFHWFDALAALREFHRILRPAGRLALMWNIKESSDSFSAGFCRIAEEAQRDAATRGLIVPEERGADAELGGFFGNVRVLNFDNPQTLNLDGVLGRARSASYFPKAGPLREELERELTRLFEEGQRDGRVTLAHRTELTLADRM